MGEESQGMLLASSTEGDAILSLLQPAIDIPAGTRVR
jgi:tRNA-binding EMAP/Myf-like protein